MFYIKKTRSYLPLICTNKANKSVIRVYFVL